MKKGFTLIELLAVIVILAVLALIATPIVLNIIDDSKESATLRSSENYIKAIEFSIAKSVMENKKLFDGEYPIMTNGNICIGTLTGDTCDDELVVEVSGETPESGKVTIKSRKIDSYEFTYASGFVVINGSIQETDSETENIPEFANAIITKAKDNNYYYETTPDFSMVTADGEYGLYQAPDDLGTSYYFRGDTEDNYVQFGEETFEDGMYAVTMTVVLEYNGDNLYDSKNECLESEEFEKYGGDCYEWEDGDGLWYVFSDEQLTDETFGSFNSYEACESSQIYEDPESYLLRSYSQYSYVVMDDAIISCDKISDNETFPLYWRIVRINGDDTIRLIFDGYKKDYNEIVHTASIGNTIYIEGYDATDVDYYGTNIKTYMDNWYVQILKTKYGSYIADSIFCNDKEVVTTYYYDEEYEEVNPGDDYEYLVYSYGASSRLSSPKLTCTNKIDKYTMSTTLGNGLLTNPIGLITVDEMIMSGMNRNTYSKNYLFSGEEYWTISPEAGEDGNGGVIYFGTGYGTVDTEGFAYEYERNIRPVINLKADVKFTGDGSYDNPYVIVTD